VSGLKLGIVSQTPLIRFKKQFENFDKINLRDLSEEDYSYTVGGVTAMEKVLSEYLLENKITSEIHWFSLNPGAPKHVIFSNNFHLYNVSLPHNLLTQYTSFKETLWNNIHGIGNRSFNLRDYLGYLHHNWKLTENVLNTSFDFDIYVIHDFQQLLMGNFIGPSKPAVLRWHIPFIPEYFNKQIKKFILNSFEGFDSVIVSTKRDLEGLIRVGFRGHAYQVYPHIDPKEWKKVDDESVENFSKRYNIRENDFLVLNVARMDPIKSQDILLKAIKKLKIENIKVMLVGNGSFTSSPNGLKASKGKDWRDYLNRLTKQLNLEDKVIFTGYLPKEDLYSAYQRADLFVLPSIVEGFGLTVVESWLYEKCTIVSNGAGVSELITDEVNGFTFKRNDHKDLAEKIKIAYLDEDLRKECGVNARKMAKQCYVSSTAKKIEKVLRETIENF